LLGFNVRRYRGKLLIKPSKAAIGRIRERLRTELRSLRGTNAQAVIRKLNPIIRGWAAYYRTQVSSETFKALDQYLWTLTYKWATFSHANKPTSWVVHRYFRKFNKARQDRWVFGDRASGAFIHKFSWTNIAPLPINRTALRLHRAQDGRCAICESTLVAVEDRPQTPHQWETWLASSRKTIDVTWETGTSDTAEPRLIHRRCNTNSGPALLPTRQPSGLA
jgi:RNA-directed DNA polymerase